MMILDFLTSPKRLGTAGAPQVDALTEAAALEEAALIDIRVNPVAASAWLLFDCKGALEVSTGNTAILVVKSLEHLEWVCPSPVPPSWWTVWGWRPTTSEGLFVIDFVLDGGGAFRAKGTAAEFFVGDVPGGDEAPPDFTAASAEEIREGLVQWTSPFTPISASFLNLASD